MTAISRTTESRRRPVLRAAALALFAAAVLPVPASALDLFARREVTAQFATAEGTPMGHAQVRVFAPSDPKTPVATGRTDAGGKFQFDAPRDGFWTAEARDKSEVARVMIRVGGQRQPANRVSPLLVIGLLSVLVAAAGWYRFSRLRRGGKR